MGDLCPECQARFAPQPQPGPTAHPQQGAPAQPSYPGPQTFTGQTSYPGAPIYPGQPPTGQGPQFVYRQDPLQQPPPQGYPQAGYTPMTPPPAQPSGGSGRTTVAIVVGLVVLVLAAGVGMVMMLLGGDSDLATDAVATPAPATTVYVSVAPPSPTAEPTTAAPPSTETAAVPDAPALPSEAAVQPIVEEPVVVAPPAQPQVFERYYPLFPGDQGYVVSALQELLSWRGIRTLSDGDFGPATERSVRLWQAQEGLAVTGVVDDTTWDSLVPRLTQGSQGEGVAVLQRLLNYRGYETVVDGDFGPETDATVRAFQAERGIPVDGLVGPVTWATLLA